MEIIKFKECNIVFAEDQPEYLPLPAYMDEEGLVISCWKPSLKERIKILFKGKIYVSMLTFNHPLQPIRLDTEFIKR